MGVFTCTAASASPALMTSVLQLVAGGCASSKLPEPAPLPWPQFHWRSLEFSKYVSPEPVSLLALSNEDCEFFHPFHSPTPLTSIGSSWGSVFLPNSYSYLGQSSLLQGWWKHFSPPSTCSEQPEIYIVSIDNSKIRCKISIVSNWN